jgi:hypothetical protein
MMMIVYYYLNSFDFNSPLENSSPDLMHLNALMMILINFQNILQESNPYAKYSHLYRYQHLHSDQSIQLAFHTELLFKDSQIYRHFFICQFKSILKLPDYQEVVLL